MTAPFARAAVDATAPAALDWARQVVRSVTATMSTVTVEDEATMPARFADEVERTNSDLVVIGRREPTTAPWFSLDGLVHQVIERSRVPVAVVPEAWRATDVPSRIGVGVDGSARSAVAVGWTAGFAGVLGAAVWVVHAADVAPGLAGTGARGEGYDVTLRDRRTMLERDWTGPLAAGHVMYETVVEDGPPVGLLLETATKHGLDLLVVGARGADEDPAARLGSVAHRVAGLAPCPCVIVPPDFGR